MFFTIATVRSETAAMNIATISYIGKLRSGTVVVLTDEIFFNVSDGYDALISVL